MPTTASCNLSIFKYSSLTFSKNNKAYLQFPTNACKVIQIEMRSIQTVGTNASHTVVIKLHFHIGHHQNLKLPFAIGSVRLERGQPGRNKTASPYSQIVESPYDRICSTAKHTTTTKADFNETDIQAAERNVPHYGFCSSSFQPEPRPNASQIRNYEIFNHFQSMN